MSTQFVCGADITFMGDNKYVIDPMGVFDCVEDAVVHNSELHMSFGYNIYEVEVKITQGLTRCFGIRQGTKGVGQKVVRLVCAAYNHPSWPGRS